MSKVLFLGDIHGQSTWEKYAGEAMKAGYEIVFLGDYVDSFDINQRQIEQNLLRIIAYKKRADKRKNFSNVTLLIGNHDYAYIAQKSTSPGYDTVWASQFYEIFNKNWGLFDIAWGYVAPFTQEYTLATHAGLTKNWVKNYLKNPKYDEHQFVKRILGENAFETKKLHEILNVLKDKFDFLWKIGAVRGGSSIPGPIWADYSELIEDPIEDINQIVGHTGWHSMEFKRINNNKNFIAKIDGCGDIQRMIIDL